MHVIGPDRQQKGARQYRGYADPQYPHEPTVPQRRAIKLIGVAARTGRNSAPRALDRISGSQRLSPKTGAPIRQHGPLVRFRGRIVALEYGFDRANEPTFQSADTARFG